jgi:hypothetical protein
MPVPTSLSSNNTKKSYLPPSLRNNNNSLRQPNQQHTSVAQSTKKTELKKEFSLADAFPTLGETMTTANSKKSNANTNANSKSNSKKSNNTEQISFSSVASTKVVEKKDTTAKEETTLLPGWVYIRKNINNKTIEYNYVESKISQQELELAYQEHLQLGRILFKYRIAREQYQRDMDVERLGDLSEYYGEPTLIEMYENDSNLHFNEDDLNSSDNDY